MRIVVLLAAFAVYGGCTGSTRDQQPVPAWASPSSRVFNMPRDSVWSSAIAALQQRPFISYQEDTPTGTLSVRYQGAPEPYIDCGKISAVDSNIGGARTYRFSAAKANHHYEVIRGGSVFYVRRSMDLEAHITLLFEDVDVSQPG